MFFGLDNARDSATTRQSLLECLVRECQQANLTTLHELLQYFFQTESSSALLLIKQFNETGKEQSKLLVEHLSNQGLKQSNRHMSISTHSESHAHEDQERVAHIMKVFRILCVIIHKQAPGLPALIKDSSLIPNCLQAITRCKDDPNILAQACYLFAALIAILPNEIAQHIDPILNILKATCKYLLKNLTSLRQLSVQTSSHSLDNVQLWIVNQSAHALFYTLYTAYPCNFLHLLQQREFQRNENTDVFENILVPMFQRVRFNPRLIDGDRRREIDKEKRSRQDSSIIYEARRLSLDPLFGRESPATNNWMHQEMKKILPFYQFKRQSPTRSVDRLSDGARSIVDVASPSDSVVKKPGTSPFQKFTNKLKSLVRPASSSSPATTIVTPEVAATASHHTLSIPSVSSSILSSPSPALMSDMRAVKTMPELQTNHDSSSASSTPVMRRSDQEYQLYVRSVIMAISMIYTKNLPSHWVKLLGRHEPNLMTLLTPQRQATFYVSPSEHSLDNQQQQQHYQQQQFDDDSPTSINDKRKRCSSASCATSQHVHSPVLAAPTTSTEDILSRTQSLSTKQRTRHSAMMSSMGGSFHPKHCLEHQAEYDEDDFDDDVLVDRKFSFDSASMPVPTELYISSESKNAVLDEFVWNDHDLIYIPHFDFNDIVTNNCSSSELKQFDRLYDSHSSYEIFLTEQYKKIWEHLWAKQKTHQKHYHDLQTTVGFMDTLRLEIRGHLINELRMCNHNSDCLSDENTLLAGKVVELSKDTSRRKQLSSTNEEKDSAMRELEKTCEQLRKTVNNETLKLNNLRSELEDDERETKSTVERLEHAKLVSRNITHLDELNQKLECQYLRFTDEMPMGGQNQLLTCNFIVGDDEQNPSRSVLPPSMRAHDANSERDSISLNDDHRDEMDDTQQPEESELENYDQLLADVIELLTNQNTGNQLSASEIESEAYTRLLDYMESKAKMQNYLLEHNSRYTDIYLAAQEDYIVQMETELASTQSMHAQMLGVPI